MASLVIATGNQGKFSEIRQILSDLPLRFLSLQDFRDIRAIEETGLTCADNAILKATSYALQTGHLTLADDSGLEVDALEGRPGVRSARYAGAETTDDERISKLLAELADIPTHRRGARFVAAIAIADKYGTIQNLSTAKCEGSIALSARGNKGFGYDPIFIPRGFELTFGELESRTKNQISHRALALVKARDYLTRVSSDD